MARTALALAALLTVACEIYATGDDAASHANGSTASQPPPGNASGGCGGEAAAGGFLAGPNDGPTNPDNPYANAASPGQQLPCSALGFYEHQVFCKFFETCDLSCNTSASCPSVVGGPVPECRKGGNWQICVLPCTETSECPNGMECVVNTVGFGQICMWPMKF